MYMYNIPTYVHVMSGMYIAHTHNVMRECSLFNSNCIGIHSKQTGFLRSNCLDCLDRSNTVQSFLASHVSLGASPLVSPSLSLRSACLPLPRCWCS